MIDEEKWRIPSVAEADFAKAKAKEKLLAERAEAELRLGLELEERIRDAMKSPAQIRQEEEYMYGPPKRNMRKPPRKKFNKRVHDKKSKLEALMDFNRVHTGNISDAKRAKLRAKRKK